MARGRCREGDASRTLPRGRCLRTPLTLGEAPPPPNPPPYIGGLRPPNPPLHWGGLRPPQTPPWGACGPPDPPAFFERASPPRAPPFFSKPRNVTAVLELGDFFGFSLFFRVHKKNRSARTIRMAVVSRRDLSYSTLSRRKPFPKKHTFWGRRRRRRKNFPSQPDPIPSRRDNISRSGPVPHSDNIIHSCKRR